MQRWWSVALCSLLVLVVVPAQAQEMPPLIETLSLLPPAIDASPGDTPPGSWSGVLFYSDWETMLNVRGVSARPADFDELDTMPDEVSDLYSAATLFSLANTPALAELVVLDAGVTGFDLRSLGQIVTIGDPPEDALLIRGAFNLPAFIEARTAAGFVVERETRASAWGGFGAAVLCSAEGCDQGRMIDPANRRVGDPLYGNLGQRPPIYIREDLVFATRDEIHFNRGVGVIEGERESLMDDPLFRTAAEAISADLTVMQAMFTFPRVIGAVSDSIAMANIGAPNLDALLAEAEATFTPIPAYEIFAFGSGVRGEQVITQIVLVYRNSADAQNAGNIVAERIATAVSLSGNRPWAELLQDRSMILTAPAVFTSETTGLSAAVIEFTAPLPTTIRLAEESQDRPAPSDEGYLLLVRGLNMRDLGFLAISF